MSKEILFNPHPKQTEFLETCLSGKYSFVLFGGAIRGGKTYAMLGLFILLSKMFPGSRWAIVRANLVRIRQTVLPTFNQICPVHFIEKQPSQFNDWTVTFTNGSQIIFFAENIDKDPDLDRFKGLEIDGLGFEEMDVTEKGFEKGLERVGTWKMGKRKEAKEKGLPTPPNFAAGTCNPSQGWVKKRLFDKWKNNSLPKTQKYIPSKVWDNPYIEKSWIEQKRSDMTPLNFKRFVEGDWEVNLNEHPFFYEFSEDKHKAAKQMTINPNEVLWLSFDFNIEPTTCIVSQKLGDGLKIYKVHQVNGGTRKLCQELKQYTNYIIKVTGDNSGTARSTVGGMKGGQHINDYQIIREELDLIPRQFIDVKTANRQHVYSRQLCNSVLHRLPLMINPNGCDALLSDLATGQPTKDGKLLKDRQNHKQDAGDAFRYQINAWFLGGFDDLKKYERLIN